MELYVNDCLRTRWICGGKFEGCVFSQLQLLAVALIRCTPKITLLRGPQRLRHLLASTLVSCQIAAIVL